MPNPSSNESMIKSGKIAPSMTFNEKVWAVCARIPKGKVATYGDIARALNSPQAARAVGGALNKNPYAPQVPCHRVVGGTGALTGFAGGLPKKQELLAQEGIQVVKERINLKACRAEL